MGEDIIIPDSIFYSILKPFAKSLKLRYIPKTPKLLIRAIFDKLAEKAKEHSVNLKPIISNTEDIAGVFSSYLEIFGAMLKPILNLVPAHYVAIALAIIIIPTVILPLRFLGIFLYYKAESILKIPFAHKSLYDIEKIPAAIRNTMYIIERIKKRTITITYKKFFKLSTNTQNAYFYEASQEVKNKLYAVKFLLEKFPSFTTDEVIDLPDILGLPASIDLSEEFELSAHFFSGKKRVLPPILTKLVNGLRTIYVNFEDKILNMDDDEPLWEKTLELFVFGIFGKPVVDYIEKEAPGWLEDLSDLDLSGPVH